MTSTLTASRGHRRLLLAVLGCCLLFTPLAILHAQCTVPIPDPNAPPPRVVEHPAGEDLLPENGHLSNTTYTNDFFGFSFDLPQAVQGHLVMLPLMPSHQHALLALAYEDGSQHGTLTVAAIDPHPGLEPPTPEEQKNQFRTWANQGNPGFTPPGRMPIPDYMLHTGRFTLVVHHKHDSYVAIFSTRIKNYNVKVLVTSNDKSFIDKTKQALSDTQFYCIQDDGTLTTSDGKIVRMVGDPYEGPTVPTARVEAALKDQPALQGIPLGGVSGGVYRNPELGLQYDLPQGWQVLASGNTADPPKNITALREQEFLYACSKTLLRVIAPPAASHEQPVPRPMIVLRALDPTCLSLRTPASMTDHRTAAEVGSSLETLGEFGEVSSHELVSLSDHLFVLFRGTIGSRAAGEELATRMSQSIYLTRHNKMLLVWSLIAPTSNDLNAFPSTRIAFDNTAPFELRPTITAKNR